MIRGNVPQHFNDFSATNKLPFDRRFLRKTTYEVLPPNLAQGITTVNMLLKPPSFKMSSVVAHEQ